MRIATLNIFLLFLPMLLIGILIGVYVYKDATRRGMNAPLWTIVAVFAPSLIGLILYLLIRGNGGDLNCPNCGEKVQEDFILCPRCNTKLKATCPNCASPCESVWRVCPRCAAPLPPQAAEIVPPVNKTDKTLGKILIAVIITPVLLLLALMLFSATGFATRSSSSVTTFLPAEEYTAEMENPEITQWLASCDTTKQAVYALRYTREAGDQKFTGFAVYFPFDLSDGIDTHIKNGLFKQYAVVDLGGDARKFKDKAYHFLLFSSTTEDYLTLQATYQGQKIPCEVTQVDFDPTRLE